MIENHEWCDSVTLIAKIRSTKKCSLGHKKCMIPFMGRGIWVVNERQTWKLTAAAVVLGMSVVVGKSTVLGGP